MTTTMKFMITVTLTIVAGLLCWEVIGFIGGLIVNLMNFIQDLIVVFKSLVAIFKIIIPIAAFLWLISCLGAEKSMNTVDKVKSTYL